MNDDNSFQIEDARDDLPIFVYSEFDDLPLTVNAVRVYVHLARRAGKNNEAWPSYKSIGEHCFRATLKDAKPDTWRRLAITAVSELESFGLVSVQKRGDKDKGNTSNMYRLTPRRSWRRP